MSDDQVKDALLRPLTESQQRTIDLVCESFFIEETTWPKFQYIEAELDKDDIDLRSVLSSFPVAGGHGGISYGALGALPHLQSANEDADVTMTVLGLWHCRSAMAEQPAKWLAASVLQVLSGFVALRSPWQSPRTQVGHLEVTSSEIMARLQPLAGRTQE